MLVALIALVVALGGTALAASRYLITSTSQIKPSVLRELRSEAAKTAAVPKGPKAVIDRARLATPVETITEPEGQVERPPISLSSATWTQAAHQVNAIVGQVTVSNPPEAQCFGRGAYVEIVLDGKFRSIATAYINQPERYEAQTTYSFEWTPPLATGGSESSGSWLIDPSAATSHTLSARASDYCNDGSHFTIDSIEVDVLGFR
jgi:hypothetical protein